MFGSIGNSRRDSVRRQPVGHRSHGGAPDRRGCSRLDLRRRRGLRRAVRRSRCRGGIALLSHTGKAGVRLAINTSPEPASNVAVSTAENAVLLGVRLLATQYPWLAAGTALALLVVTLATVVVIAGRAGRGWNRLRHRYFPDTRGGTG